MPLPPSAGKICVAIQAASPTELVERARASLADSSFLEFRLDALPDPLSAIAAIRALLADNPQATAIATCRRIAYGGGFAGSPAEELAILRQAIAAGCQLVDLEIDSAEQAGAAQMQDMRQALRQAGAALLLSDHDFAGTQDLEAVHARMLRFAPDGCKVVSTARTLRDNLALLRFLEAHTGIGASVPAGTASQLPGMVAIAMGEQGILTRVLGPRSGAAFTFAAAADGQSTAPGQVTAATLRDLYRADSLDRAAKVYGVAGNPIAHSLSPRMQNAAFQEQGIQAVFLPLKTESLDDLIALVHGLPLAGMAVTMPLKQQILPYLARMDALTARIGASNTIRREADGTLSGFNTDVDGVVAPLEKRMALKGARALVLGAGGAARAAVFGLVDKGAEVYLLNRAPAAAHRLADEAGARVLDRQKLPGTSFDILINATPCGMASCSQSLPIEPEELNAGTVFDLVYNPIETPLIRLARQRGLAVLTGVEMFVRQGARQFAIWTGEPAPEARMLAVVMEALAGAGEQPIQTRLP